MSFIVLYCFHGTRKWIGDPFRPDLPLPDRSSALLRCSQLYKKAVNLNSNAASVAQQRGSNELLPAARLITGSPHTGCIADRCHTSTPPAARVSDTSTNPGSTTTSSLTPPGESVESVTFIVSDNNFKPSEVQPSRESTTRPLPIYQPKSASCQKYKTLHKNDEGANLSDTFFVVPQFAINWMSFLQATSPRRQTFIDNAQPHRLSPLHGNPLLHIPSAYRGVEELWVLKTTNADPAVIAATAEDPSGLLPVDSLSFQACCRMFQLLVLQSGCFMSDHDNGASL